MKDIQIITSDSNVEKYESLYNGATISEFSSPKSFDSYKINILDLTIEEVYLRSGSSLKNNKDFNNIRTMITNSNDTNFIFCLPMNIIINNKHDLKYCVENITNVLDEIIYGNKITLFYENTETKICDELIESNFAFNLNANAITKSTSNKTTTIKIGKNIYTTMQILNDKKNYLLLNFLEHINLYKNSIDIPQWLKDYCFNDDIDQKNKIEKSRKKIEEEQEKIKKAQEQLDKNMLYKSILINNGEELVKVVLEMLENIFDISLANFIDNHREDFLFAKNGITYIGEIKGITSNVKHSNIMQLSVHHSSYLDEMQERNQKVGKVVKLLIVNYERTKDINKRDEVHEMQIALAKKQETLIMDTKSLLDLYESILKNEITKQDAIDYINQTYGLINVNKIKEK